MLLEEGGLEENGDDVGVGSDGSNTLVGIRQTPGWMMVGGYGDGKVVLPCFGGDVCGAGDDEMRGIGSAVVTTPPVWR